MTITAECHNAATAESATSASGTSRTWRDVRLESTFGVERKLISSRQVAFWTVSTWHSRTSATILLYKRSISRAGATLSTEHLDRRLAAILAGMLPDTAA